MKNMDSAKKMKIGFNKLALGITLLAFAAPSFAAGTIIAVTVIGLTAGSFAAVATAFVINMAISAIITKAFFSPQQPSGGGSGGLAGDSPNPGNRQQVPPATDNKLPVVYGSAWLGGTITDLSISENNQELYYVISLCEVTDNGNDTITFGDVYWGGKKVVFKDSGNIYTPIGVVSSVSGTKVFFENISTFPANGASFTFVNTGTPTVYTVASSNESENSITYTTSVTGVSSGYTGYIKTIEVDYATKVTKLIDESTGEEDTSVAGKMQIYLYKNGSLESANSTTNAIQVMQASGLIYKWNSDKLMSNCAFAILHISYNQNAGLTGMQQTKFQVTNSRYKPGDCFNDYLTNNVYGAAIDASQIDTTSLAALNTYCDQSFTYTDYEGNTTTQTRFRFDGVISTDRSIMDNLQDMASSCDCLIKYNEIQGKWGVVVQSPTYSIAMELNDSNMVSAIQITPLDIAGSYNVIECKFPDNSNQDAFNSSTFDLAEIAPSLLYPNEPVNKQSISLQLVNNDVRAQYIAIRLLKASREDLQVQVTISFEGIQLEAGDIVTITNTNYGWVAKEFRVMKVTEDFSSNGSVTAKLILTEFTPSIYDDTSITQFQPSPNTGIASPLVFGNVPAPVVSASYPTNANPLFLVNITASAQGIIQYAEVWYSAFANPTASQLIFAGTTEIQSNGTPYDPGTALPPVTLAGIPAGTWYFFSRMVNSLGTSPYSIASSAFVWKPTTFQYSERYLDVAYADNATGTSNFSFTPTNRLYYGLRNVTTPTLSTDPSLYSWFLADPGFGTAVYLAYANRTGRKFSFATGFANYAANTGAFVPTQATIFDPRLWAALPIGSYTIDLDYSTGQVLQTGTTTVGTGEIAVTNNPDGKIIASLKPYLDFGSGVYQQTVTGVAQLTIDIYGRVVGFTTPDPFYMTIDQFTATANQTVFTVTRGSGYIADQCLVFVNGVLFDESEYTDTAGSTGTVTFATGLILGDKVTITSMKSSNSGTPYASFTRNTATLTNASAYTPGFALASGYELLFLNGTVMVDQDYDIVGGVITNFPSLATGLITVIQWTPNNLGLPAGDAVNVLQNTITGQSSYPFSYTTDAFNLYQNGLLLFQGSDYTTTTGGYSLTTTPTSNTDLLLQQSFARTGAV
jgi:hypothetical protein